MNGRIHWVRDTIIVGLLLHILVSQMMWIDRLEMKLDSVGSMLDNIADGVYDD